MEGFWDPDAEQWTHITDEVLIRIFQQLEFLSSFTFSASDNWSDCFPPEDMRRHISSPLMIALSSMLQSLHITELQIHGFTNIPIAEIVIGCSYLIKLSLSNTNANEWEITPIGGYQLPKEPESTTGEPIQAKHYLKVLKLDWNADLTAYDLYKQAILPHSFISLSHLRKFRSSSRYMEECPNRIISHCAESLETLTLECGHFRNVCIQVRDIGSFEISPFLLSLRTSFDHPHAVTPCHMIWLCGALQDLAEEFEGNNLEEIVLVLNIDIDMEDNLGKVWCESDGWTTWLDELLTSLMTIFVKNPSHFEHRDCVPGQRYIEINRRLEEKLYLLHAKGMLSGRWLIIEEGVNTLELQRGL